MTAYAFFLAFTVLVGVVGGFCAVLEWHDRRRFDAHVDAALDLVRAPEVVAREEAAWIDAEWPVVSREWSS